MAKLQLSISHTFVLNTDEWPQSELDLLYAQLGTETPTTERLEDSIRKLLVDNDSEFWDEHIDLGEIDSQNVKVVCIDNSFNRFAKQIEPVEAMEEGEDVKTPPSGKPEMASKPKTSIADKAATIRPNPTATHSSPSSIQGRQPQGRQPTHKK